MNLKKLSLGLAALIGFGLMITLNAFTNSNEKRADRYWQFNSGSTSDIRDGSNYTELSTPPSQSPCEVGDDLPCVLKVDASIDSQSDLSAYLQNTAMFPDASAITSAAIYQKDAE